MKYPTILGKNWSATVLMLLWCGASSSFARAPGSGDEFENLSSSVAKERESAVDSIIDRRKAEITQLLRIALADRGETELERAEADVAKDRAIFLLGQYRAVEAVPMLVKEIDFLDDGTGETTEIHPLAGYRAATALVRIGDPVATRGIIERMKEPVSDRHLTLFAHVIAALQGRGNERLGVARSKAALEALQNGDPDREDGATFKPDPKRVKNLERLIAMYEKAIADHPYADP